jgi:hypothetical protein
MIIAQRDLMFTVCPAIAMQMHQFLTMQDGGRYTSNNLAVDIFCIAEFTSPKSYCISIMMFAAHCAAHA